MRTRAKVRLIRASAARYAAGRPAKKTNGSAPAAMTGIRSKQEACAQLASISGLKHSAFRAANGRRIRSGMRSNLSRTIHNLQA
jgi:hypothetical protein